MKVINDKILGELIYNYGWVKEEEVNFNSKKYKIENIMVSYNEEEVTENQKNQYLWLKESFKNIEELLLIQIKKYISKEYKNVNIDMEKIIPKSFIYERDEEIINMIFDCSFDDENGIGITIKNKKIVDIGYQNIAL